MARAAGVEVPETRLVEERGLAHRMTRRFDRVEDRKIHLHSLGDAACGLQPARSLLL